MDSKPLAGKRIVITRAAEQAREMIGALETLGAEVLLMPTVEFAPPEDWQKLDAKLRKLDGFDAILFLSRNAVRYIFERCRELGIKCEALQSKKCMIAAVGQGTAQAIESEGFRVDYVAKNQSGESLVSELGGRVAGRKVLLPRSDRGDERLSKALRDAGANVTELVAYRTGAPEEVDPGMLSLVREAKVDAIVFASPSAFQTFADCMGGDELATLSARIRFAAIGPTTANAIRNAGARVEIQSVEPSAAGVANSLARYYQRQTASVRPA
ncbi:MAG: uroporphyrinogen-III synthase [Candidatus Acidiferrales bacterium]